MKLERLLRKMKFLLLTLSIFSYGFTINTTTRCRKSLQKRNISLDAAGAPYSREVLSAADRMKADPSPDAFFYGAPRFVFHVDSNFTRQLTQLYRERIPPGSSVLDMMSSWVSHLPADVPYTRVDGQGLNFEELARNPQLSSFRVHDLNSDPHLPFNSCTFDTVTCAVSVQYLQYPERVFADIGRVLKPGGCAIISFSNRMFGSKAINGWMDRTDAERIRLVCSYFECVCDDGIGPTFSKPEAVVKEPTASGWLASLARNLLSANLGGDPFFAVIAYKL